MALNREALDALRTADVPLVFTPRCHPGWGSTSVAYIGDGIVQAGCDVCGAEVVQFEVTEGPGVIELLEPACPDCGWAMSDHGDPPKCPPPTPEPTEGGSRR